MDSATLALEYLDQGWSVVPCHVPVDGGCSCGRDTCSWPGKHPRVSWRQYSERLPTVKEVHNWFDSEFYESNVGIVTGRVSGIAVVDVDGAFDAYRKLKLPKTLEAITGGGGRHYYYRLDEPMPSRIGMVEGIDLKADGGFVVAPPSIHNSGRTYMWRVRRELQPLTSKMLPRGGERLNGSDWFDDLLNGVPEGDRSVTAARLAGRYCSLGLTLLETYLLLTGWNQANHPPLKTYELKATVKAVYRKHNSNNKQTTVESVESVYQMLRTLTGRDS